MLKIEKIDWKIMCNFNKGRECQMEADVDWIITTVADKIDFLIANPEWTRFNYQYDNLPEEIKKYLKDLVTITLEQYKEKPDCELCAQKVNQVFSSIKNLFELWEEITDLWKYKEDYIRYIFPKANTKEIMQNFSLKKIKAICEYLDDDLISYIWEANLLDERLTSEKIIKIWCYLTIEDIEEIGLTEIVDMSEQELINQLNDT